MEPASYCSGLCCSCPCELWHSPAMAQGLPHRTLGRDGTNRPLVWSPIMFQRERETGCSELHGDPAQPLFPDASGEP